MFCALFLTIICFILRKKYNTIQKEYNNFLKFIKIINDKNIKNIKNKNKNFINIEKNKLKNNIVEHVKTIYTS